MRLSLVFELLLIFVLIAFAASRVIDSTELSTGRSAPVRKIQAKPGNKNRQQDAANKYCTCTAKLCNCCREFNIPVVALQGPGCASLQYLRGDRLAISMSFGERVLTNTTIDGRKPKPVCMPLPGGVSKFCGRVYNIGRQGEDFNACLGLELRAVQDVEAALRVSCFRFGPKGLKVEAPQPLPVVEEANNEDDDDDDDDDDDEFDFDDVDDIDVEDDDDDDDDDDEDDADNDVDSVDYETFSVFDDDFIDNLFVDDSDSGGGGGGSGNKRKKVTTTLKPPVRKVTRKPVVPQRKPVVKKKPVTTVAPVVVVKEATKKVTSTTSAPVQKVTSTTQRLVQKVKSTTKAPVQKVTKKSPTRRVTRPRITTRVTSTSTTTTTTTTTEKPLIIPVTAVTQEILPQKVVNSVLDVKVPEDNAPPAPSPHESIAAVTAMLQDIPGEKISQVAPVDVKPAPQVPEPVRVASSPVDAPVEPAEILPDASTEKSTEYITDPVTEQQSITTEPQETTHQEAATEADAAIETTTYTEDADSTTKQSDEDEAVEEVDEEETEEEEAPSQSYIIKNEDDESAESDEDSDPLSDAVEDVLGDDDDEKAEGTTEAQPDAKTPSKKESGKPDNGDVISDIIDGVVDTFGADDSEENTKSPGVAVDSTDDDGSVKKTDKESDEEDDDILDDDDDDEEDEDGEEDDEDDDDDFGSRKAKLHKIKKSGMNRVRQSRDMWLDRLHW